VDTRNFLIRAGDVMAAPLTLAASLHMKVLRRLGTANTPVSRWIFDHVGVFPIRDHYYEPLFDSSRLHSAANRPRTLPGIDFRIADQLELLKHLTFQDELLALQADEASFDFANVYYGAGDAELLYSFIRLFKPLRIIEVGSGNSTLIARLAILQNASEDSGYACKQICIEPFEHPWLEETSGVAVVRTPVENVSLTMFDALGENDILFIDSSHIVRPGGDVWFVVGEILPRLRRGVLVHFHDIFTPRDYPRSWIVDDVRLWNEQYMVEAFLAHNRDFEVLCSLNQLCHDHGDLVRERFPIYAQRPRAEPGALWIRRVDAPR
jgi:Methyltransferase domain